MLPTTRPQWRMPEPPAADKHRCRHDPRWVGSTSSTLRLSMLLLGPPSCQIKETPREPARIMALPRCALSNPSRAGTLSSGGWRVIKKHTIRGGGGGH